jgi:hypothetical protein
VSTHVAIASGVAEMILGMNDGPGLSLPRHLPWFGLMRIDKGENAKSVEKLGGEATFSKA